MKVFILAYDTKGMDSKELLEKVVKLLLSKGVRKLSKPLGTTIVFQGVLDQTFEYWQSEINKHLDKDCYYILGETAFFENKFNVYSTEKYKYESQYSASSETFAELVRRLQDEVDLKKD